jgi:hypothetical protein
MHAVTRPTTNTSSCGVVSTSKLRVRVREGIMSESEPRGQRQSPTGGGGRGWCGAVVCCGGAAAAASGGGLVLGGDSGAKGRG